jgi:hypothetical protein
MRRSWVVALLVLVGACTGPVRSFEVYESKAGQTAEVAVSAVQTALLAVDAAKGEKAYGRYLTQVLVEAEEDAGAAQGTFDGIQCPGWPRSWMPSPRPTDETALRGRPGHPHRHRRVCGHR